MIKKNLWAISLLLAVFTVQAQSIEDGTNIIGLGIRLGVYNMTVTYNPPAPNPSYKLNGQAADVIYPISYERGINDHLTLGGQFRYNSFILGKDTAATQINVAYGIDVYVDAAYHFVRSEHTDLYIQALAGFGYLKIANTNINNQGVLTAAGIAYGAELGARFYLGNHIGILLNFS